jgi:antitoxin FitA
MADLKVRNVDDHVVEALKARAKRQGISLEEEVRRSLTASVQARKEAFIRRAAELRARIAAHGDASQPDSAKVIREERDAWG